MTEQGTTRAAQVETPIERARHYVPRIVLRQLAERPDETCWSVGGTVVFVDITGFTKLSERLAKRGREGAEHITDAIGRCFGDILAVAYANGGSLIKFGGDALLLLFQDEGHAERACRSAIWMRRALREAGRIELPGARVQLRMSVGVHSGQFHFFMVGGSHRELVVAGPAWTRTVEMEAAASAGQILLSPETAAHLPARCLGSEVGSGWLLVREPPATIETWHDEPIPVDPEIVAGCLSVSVREHVAGGGGAPEHRPVTVAFVHFDGTDELISRQGPRAAAEALMALVADVTAAADSQGVAFLSSDVDADGGKLILAAGAPRVTGEDEERMLLALRVVTAGERVIPVRIGVHRGAVFAGDIGPWYRQTYTVMGDVVNLAARLMARARPGQIVATADVLDRSWTLFDTTGLEPFMVKGKARPIQAWTVGPPVGSRGRAVTLERFSLVGRGAEMAALEAALASARGGDGRVVEVVGEAGVGKTRLLEELRSRADGFALAHATCEAYTSATPYVAWREILRHLLGLGWDDPDEEVLARLRALVEERAPDLAPWLPLLSVPLDADAPPTPETAALGEQFRRPRLHELMARFLEVALPGPILIEIEDGHHMDEASADLLRSLARPIGGWPWLILVTRRPEAGGFEAEEIASVVRVEPGPLAIADAVTLAEAATEADPLPDHAIRTIAERSGGNPQFLRELVRSALASGGVDQLPDSVEAAAMARIDRLAPTDRTLVRRAAVLGQSFHPRSMSWVLDPGEPLPEPSSWDRLTELFEDDGGGYLRFRRALLRDAAYEGLPYRVRRQLHARVGDGMEAEALADGTADDVADLLSLHFLRAGAYDKAWHYGRLAGNQARAKYAPLEAAALYRRAIDAARTADPPITGREVLAVTEAMADVLTRAGAFDRALRAYADARRAAGSDPITEARLMLGESFAWERVGRVDQVVRWTRRAERVLAGVEGDAAARLRASALVSLAWARQLRGATREAALLARRAADVARAARDQKALADAYHILDLASFKPGVSEEPVHCHAALEIYERIGDLANAAVVANTIGGLAYFRGDWDQAVRHYELSREASERLGDPIAMARALYNIGEVQSDRGVLDDAEARLRRAQRLLQASGVRQEWALATAFLARSVYRAGRFEEGRALLGEAAAANRELGVEHEVVRVEAWRAESLALEGRHNDALEASEEILGTGTVTDETHIAVLERVRGLALAGLRRAVEARVAFAASAAAAARAGSDYERAVTLHILARVLPADSGALEADLASRPVLARLGVAHVPMPTQ